MRIRIEQIQPMQWRLFSERAHLLCFGKNKPVTWDRIDFALLGLEQDEPLGYITCREVDATTLYWQFGGAFPAIRGSFHSFRVYEEFVKFCKDQCYERITTLIENDNLPMLKMAMKVGFRVIGVRTFKGSILLEHLLEFPCK